MGSSLSYVENSLRESIAVKESVLADEKVLNAVDRVSQACIDALRRGNRILLAGNGGSAADAQHISAEFVSRFMYDRPGLPAMALTTDTSALTAIGNDYGYELLFQRQLEANGRAGDIFIGITTSGNSKNILSAVRRARELGIFTVCFCGAGGVIASLCDAVIAVPSTSTPRIQEAHITIGHIICGLVETAIFPQPT
jgi:D-sedoheptulose 7-phosphate isomerase